MFKNFIDNYIARGFMNISRQDAFIIEMEKNLCKNKQFFYVADLMRLQILFISNEIKNLIGINSHEFNLSTFLSRTHPDDQTRYAISRTKLIKTGQDLFLNQEGISILSTPFRQKNSSGNYCNLLFQGYAFYSEVPFKTVYLILVLTDISNFRISKHGVHYYLGDNPDFFRYPDPALMKTGYAFSNRQYEILQQIAAGMDSKQIADKLNLSVHTVNTHRRNILKKTKKSTTQDIVIDLKERGIF